MHGNVKYMATMFSHVYSFCIFLLYIWGIPVSPNASALVRMRWPIASNISHKRHTQTHRHTDRQPGSQAGRQADQNRTEQNRTDQTRPEQSRAAQDKTGQDRTGQDRTEQNRTEQTDRQTDKTDGRTDRHTYRCTWYPLPNIYLFYANFLVRHWYLTLLRRWPVPTPTSAARPACPGPSRGRWRGAGGSRAVALCSGVVLEPGANPPAPGGG